jgi:hypothetical protein
VGAFQERLHTRQACGSSSFVWKTMRIVEQQKIEPLAEALAVAVRSGRLGKRSNES